MRTKSREILEKLNIPHQYIEDHEPVLDYEAAARVDEKYGLEGIESKCLMMKSKSGKYVVLITTEGVRMDSKYIKNLIGEKVRLATADELKEISGYLAGCAAPFPYPEGVKYLVDNRIFDHEKYICSAGIPTDSFVVETKYLKEIYERTGADVTYLDDYPL